MDYTIAETRLLELLRIELQHKIITLPIDHIHYDVDIAHYKDNLTDDAKVLLPTRWTDDIRLQPASSKLLSLVKPHFENGINSIASGFDTNPLLSKLADMDQQDVYSMFGCSLNDLSGATHISACVYHGLYDDGELGVIIGDHGIHVISQVGDDYDGRNIYEEDLHELIRVKRLASDYYADNRPTLDDQTAPKLCTTVDGLAAYRNHPRRAAQSEYFRLGRLYDSLLETYMDSECKRSVDAAAAVLQKRRDDMRARLGVN